MAWQFYVLWIQTNHPSCFQGFKVSNFKYTVFGQWERLKEIMRVKEGEWHATNVTVFREKKNKGFLTPSTRMIFLAVWRNEKRKKCEKHNVVKTKPFPGGYSLNFLWEMGMHWRNFRWWSLACSPDQLVQFFPILFVWITLTAIFMIKLDVM